MKRTLIPAIVVIAVTLAVLGGAGLYGSLATAQTPHRASSACPHDDSGLRLPAGFCASVFADGIGHARQMVVAPNGVVYVNTWSGRYYGNDMPHAGGFLVALQDTTAAGKATSFNALAKPCRAEVQVARASALYKGALYAEINDRIVRYALRPAPSSRAARQSRS